MVEPSLHAGSVGAGRFGAGPIGAVPVGAGPVSAGPVGAVPVGAVPVSALPPVTVTVRYFAAARAAAGVAEELLTIRHRQDFFSPDGPGAATGEITVAMVLAEASDRHGAGLAGVLPRCSYLLDEIAVHGVETAVRDGQLLDVLPPFAGG